MKKKIGDLTLKEVAEICIKCKKHTFKDCTFPYTYWIDCPNDYDDETIKFGLDQEIEVEENV